MNVVQPFAVVNWSPQDGATCIATDWTLGVCMTRKVDAKTLAQVKVRPLDSAGTAGDAVTTTNAVSKNDTSCVTITPPSAGLAPNAEFEIELGKGFGSGRRRHPGPDPDLAVLHHRAGLPLSGAP